MSDSSDGRGSGARKKEVIKTKGDKQRSYSFGSYAFVADKLNVSQAEINAESRKKPEIRTYLDKAKPYEELASGGVDSNLIENLFEDVGYTDLFNQPNDLNIDKNIVFNPRKSIARSPVKTLENTQILNSNEQSSKRRRSDSTPDGQKLSKKRFDDRDSNNESDGNQMIENVIQSIEKIEKATEANIDGDFKFGIWEQQSIRSGTAEILKILTKMAYQLGKLEKENFLLKQNAQTVQATPVVKTYASSLTSNEKNQVTENTVQKKTQQAPWKTPPTSNRLETLVRISNIADPKITVQKLKENFKDKDTEGGFKAVRHTKTGAVIIESHNKKQHEKLKNVLVGKSDVTVKDLQKTEPMFMITGIERGYSENEFIEELFHQNAAAHKAINTEDRKKIEVVTRKICRNPLKENWILRAPPTVAKWFLKTGVISFDLTTAYIKECLPLTICFKCCGYGHVAKYCQKKVCCHKCANEHSPKDCQETILVCTNCKQMGYNEVSHSARDKKCPIYKRKLERTRLYVNYGTEEKNFLA